MLNKKKLSAVLLVLVFTSGCSSFIESTRKSLLSGDSPRKTSKQQPKWVSKNQYDDLMIKYKNLQSKYENLKEEKLTSKDAFNQIDELTGKSKATETVDLFSDKNMAKSPVIIEPKKLSPLDENTVSKELKLYRKAVALYKAGSFDDSLKIFQHLNKSGTKQVAVRAKKRTGDIYFMKKQYDLSLQVYEEIIRGSSFSGVVLKALSGAANSARQLGLENKRVKFESLLKDVFFEEQV